MCGRPVHRATDRKSDEPRYTNPLLSTSCLSRTAATLLAFVFLYFCFALASIFALEGGELLANALVVDAVFVAFWATPVLATTALAVAVASNQRAAAVLPALCIAIWASMYGALTLVFS